jgi:hypothetical protein
LQINGRAQLDFKGRRMFCAMTHDLRTVWVTFLAKSSGHSEIYLHSCPSLDHQESTIDLDDIDYSTVTKDFGILVTRHNFKERALGVWSFRGPMELKTMEVLEGRVEGMWNNPIDLTHDDDCYDNFSNIPVKQEPPVEPKTSVQDDSDVLMAEEEDSDGSGMPREEDIELPDRSVSPWNLKDDLFDDEIFPALILCEDSEEDFIDSHLKSFA